MATVIRAARLARDPLRLQREQRVAEALAGGSEPAFDTGGADWPQARGEAGPEGLGALAVAADAALAGAGIDPEEALAQERRHVLEEAWATGHELGRREGHEAVVEAAAAELESLRRASGALSGALEHDIAGAEDMLVEIAFEAVRRIVGEALARRDGVAAVVRAVMGQAMTRERLVVRVAPADHACLMEALAEIDAEGSWRRFELVPDERVVLGGCLLETAGGTLDGRIETQMDQLREALLDARRLRQEAEP